MLSAYDWLTNQNKGETMGNWKREFGKDYEVPAFIEHLVSIGLMEDHSEWKISPSPAFGIIDKDFDMELLLWVDHPFESMRDGSAKRLGITWGTYDKPEAFEKFDELQIALEKFFGIGAQYLRERPEFHPKGRKDAGRLYERWRKDPSKLLNDLVEEFYS